VFADVFGVAGQSVIVTGASGGIGAAIATRFAAASASVIVHYRSNVTGAEAVARGITDRGGNVALVQGDITVPDVAGALVRAAIEHFGRLDVLVNNAGLQPVASLEDMTEAAWREVVDTNVHGTFLCSSAAARRMIQQGEGGSIIHITSIEASHPAANHSHYCTSKAALVMHARSAALELGPRGIRVNTVSPGLVRRDGLAEAWPDGVARYEAAAPLGRLVEPDDVANACLFLASPSGAAVSGHDLVVDNGVSCHPTW
jgi:glucose 1-dehydrogenase/3-oxoacyl-[acyl-carrier protein] reductase